MTFGRFRSRTLTKFAVVPEKTWPGADGSRTTVRAAAAHEDTNRDGGALAPMVELAREFPSGGFRRVAFSYIKTSQVPTYTALNSSATAGLFRGNPDLGRARSHNVELALIGEMVGWTAEGAVFWRRDGSLVDWTFRQGVTARTAAAVDIDVGGIEFTARRSWQALDLVLGYTGLSKEADYRGAAVDASFYALNYAKHRITAAATLRLGQGFAIRMDNVVRFQSANMLRVVGGDDGVLSALGMTLRPPGWRGVEFAVQVDNLWDSRFQTFRRSCARRILVH